MNIQQRCAQSYGRHKNLKIVGDELDIPWQTVYVYLKKAGVPVVGDKRRYGSDSDRFAAKAENDFMALVPDAMNMNEEKYQAKFDFKIYDFAVDVKASNLRTYLKRSCAKRWAFSSKKQESVANFLVCLAYDNGDMKRAFLIPEEVFRYRATISISENGSKWDDYEIDPKSLNGFFSSMNSLRVKK